MKLVKPMAVSFSYRAFRLLGRQHLSVTSLVAFALEEDARRLVPETALWLAIGEVTPGSVDEGLPKPCGEVLLYGSCCASGGRPIVASDVRMRVSAAPGHPADRAAPLVDKKLRVIGDRFWAGTAVQGPSTDKLPVSREASAPVPFLEMPLGWDRSFGGAGFPENPVGRGMERIPVGDGVERQPLPNVESAASPITASTQRPDPVGFGALDIAWPQRQSKAGTYDDAWLEEDFPGFARDTAPSFFSVAPPDQRIQGFFRGDEEYVLENMHPTRPVLRGRLPSVAARVLLRRKDRREVEDVPTRLDTVVFLPGKEIGVLVFRGLTHVLDDEAADVLVALAACEDMDAPRSTEHYAASLQRRLDKDQSPLQALKEDDLVPSFARGSALAGLLGPPAPSGGGPDPAAAATARLRDELVAAGVASPDEALASAARMPPGLEPLAEPPDLGDPEAVEAYEKALEKLDAYGRDQLADAEKKQKEELAQLERDGLAAPVVAGGPGPPKPRAPETLESLRGAGVTPEPEVVDKLHAVDADVLDGYRKTAHYAEPVAPLSAEARSRARAEVTARRAAGESFAGLDCTAHDLSGLDLSRADLRRALLERADLTEADLGGADLSGAVLAHATLRGTRCDRATLEDTNLGSAVIEGVSFAGANLRGAIFARAKLVSASLKGADLERIDWLEAEIGAVDFEGALAMEIDFLGGDDLTRCRFPRARLTKANFVEAKLSRVDFSGAELELVTFVTVDADGADFRGASLKRFHAVERCSFRGANFEGADLTGAYLRGADLRGASFAGAILDGADLSECDLTSANLSGVRARELRLARADLTLARLDEADLMEAMLQKATLHGADLSRSNLFAANMGLVRVDAATKLKGANMKRALHLPKAKKTT